MPTRHRASAKTSARKSAAAESTARQTPAEIRAGQPAELVAAKERLDLAEEDAIQRPRIMPLEQLAVERRRAWAVHMKHATIPDALREWAARMALRFGPTFDRVPRHPKLDWLTALMVVRYGEAMESNEGGTLRQFWPLSFGDDDVRRAERWELGDVPRFAMFGGPAASAEG